MFFLLKSDVSLLCILGNIFLAYSFMANTLVTLLLTSTREDLYARYSIVKLVSSLYCLIAVTSILLCWLLCEIISSTMELLGLCKFELGNQIKTYGGVVIDNTCLALFCYHFWYLDIISSCLWVFLHSVVMAFEACWGDLLQSFDSLILFLDKRQSY